MDADDATIGTIISRREVLRYALAAGAVAALPAQSLAFLQQAEKKKSGLIASPELTEGPFFVDEKLNRSDFRGETKRRSVAGGQPLKLEVHIMKLVGSSLVALEGAQVDIWHCDATGVYSDVSSPMNHEDTSGQNWLRGFQTTDSHGVAAFTTIVPGWYPGRAPHIHFKVRKMSKSADVTAELTSQMFFKLDQIERVYRQAPYTGRSGKLTTNERDGIYNERSADGARAGDQLLLDLVPSAKSTAAKFTIVLTDTNFRAGRRRGRQGSGENELDWATF